MSSSSSAKRSAGAAALDSIENQFQVIQSSFTNDPSIKAMSISRNLNQQFGSKALSYKKVNDKLKEIKKVAKSSNRATSLGTLGNGIRLSALIAYVFVIHHIVCSVNSSMHGSPRR